MPRLGWIAVRTPPMPYRLLRLAASRPIRATPAAARMEAVAGTMPRIGTASRNRSTVLGRSSHGLDASEFALRGSATAGTRDAIPAEQEIGPLQDADRSVLHHRGRIRGGGRWSSCVFATPHAPLVRTPAAPALPNIQIHHANMTTKAVNRVITARQTSAQKNHDQPWR
jgi:hypothetical protein